MTARIIILLFFAMTTGKAVFADDLGRLFTNPEDRARIDAAREGRLPTSAAQEPVSAVTADRLMLNGTLIGSDGKRWLWLNGSRIESDGRDLPIHADGRVSLHWRDGSRLLKPGQILDRASGEVIEGYARPPESASAIPAQPGATDPKAGTSP